MRTVLLCLAALLLTFGCRPPEGTTADRSADRGSPSGGGASDGRDPGSMLSVGGLGKEDYAKIRGELDCVLAHFPGDEAAKAKAVETIYRRYGTTADWVKGVDDLTAKSPYNARISDAIETRKKQVCPGGELQPEFLALVSP